MVTGGHCSLLVFFHFYTSPSALLCLFRLSYQLSICCLVEGAELFSSLSPLLPLFDKVYSEKSWLLDGTQAAFLSPDLSVHLPLPPSFFLHFWPLSHTPPSSSIHLISSEDEDWWRYFIFFFPSPCCWVLSLLLCPAKRLITVLLFSVESVVSVNQGLKRGRGGGFVRGRDIIRVNKSKFISLKP